MAKLFQLRMRTDFGEFGNPIFNLFGYLCGDDVADAAATLALCFEEQVLALVNNVQAATAFITEIEVKQLNGSGYAILSYTDEWQGQSGADQAPPFVAWSFKMVKSTVAERSGGKRIGPICQSDFADRTVEPGALTNLGLLADRLSIPLTFETVDTFGPVILERPETEFDVWSSHPVSACVFKSVSTQNTRKT